MERPKISLMGVQSGETYLIKFINQQSQYIDHLEAEIRDCEDIHKKMESLAQEASVEPREGR